MQIPSDFSLSSQVPTDTLTGPGTRLESKIRAAQSSSGEKQKGELKKVAQEFEAIFIAYLLKAMRETIEDSGLTEGGFGKSMYTEMFDQEIAQVMARRGALGISDLLYKNLASESPVAAPADSTTSAPASESNSTAQPKTSSEATSLPSSLESITDLQLPVRAPISSAYGMRKDPLTHRAKFHQGLDLAAPEGTTVLAPLPGKIVFAGYENGYGNTVVIQHASGFQTRYGHLGVVNVRSGDVIDSQTILGVVGNTGRSTGPHLHFEVIRMGKPVDPLLEFHSRMVGAKEHQQGSSKS